MLARLANILVKKAARQLRIVSELIYKGDLARSPFRRFVIDPVIINRRRPCTFPAAASSSTPDGIGHLL
jgi:hypothetical protein